MSTDTNIRLEQITKIAQNARTSWFALLTLLVFVGVTLMGHEDSDFFAFGAETELPLVSISVSTVSFFIAAPALTAAQYVYLHIYLHGLWLALAKCPARIDRAPLEERVYPTMLCTSALVVRRRVRIETARPVEGSRAATVSISILMVWLLGPLVLGFLWWRSMPYHHEWLTLSAAFWLWLALIAGAASMFQMFYVMRFNKLSPNGLLTRPFANPRLITSAVFLVVLAIISWDTTEGGRFVPLVPASLGGTELSRKPADWLHYEMWLEDWEHRFRVRECPSAVQKGGPCPDDKLDQFKRETEQRWAARTDSLDAANLRGADLRGADLRLAFLSGANFGPKWAIPDTRPGTGARLDRADLHRAWLEGADFSLARMEGAELSWARLQSANFTGAQLKGANFWAAHLGGARFVQAHLEEAWFGRAQLEGADFSRAQLQRADFANAELAGASFYRAKLEGVNFNLAQMQGADFRSAWLESANLSFTRLQEADFAGAQLEDANIAAARLEGANFTDARLEGANFTGARLEGANFTGAQLKSADFYAARLGGVNFSKAILKGADFTLAQLQGADLRHAQGMIQTQLNDACGNQHTQLPQGLFLLNCGE